MEWFLKAIDCGSLVRDWGSRKEIKCLVALYLFEGLLRFEYLKVGHRKTTALASCISLNNWRGNTLSTTLRQTTKQLNLKSHLFCLHTVQLYNNFSLFHNNIFISRISNNLTSIKN